MKATTFFVVLLTAWANLQGHAQAVSGHARNATQFHQDLYLDVVSNHANVSAFLRGAAISTLKLRQGTLRAGVLGTYAQQGGLAPKGWFVDVGGGMGTGPTRLESNLFYRANLVSARLHEINWGAMLSLHTRHATISLGDNHRVYELTRNAVPTSAASAGGNTRIVEPRNFMYAFTWFIVPAQDRWNVSLTLTNFDHFLVQQETNPMATGRFSYQVNPHTKAYTEVWYQNAGVLNLQANYFGGYVRTGLSWQF
jgi:hypothetical protein